MEKIEYTDPANGRKYEALHDGDETMKIGPADEIVDSLELPEPFATNLHNALYYRHIFTYAEATRNGALTGALQEALRIDVQRLTEAFKNYEKEEVLT